MKKGERIRYRREQLGISQTALADQIGESKQTVYKYENGIISNIPSDKIEAIATALKISPSWIMGWGNDDIATPPGLEPLPEMATVPLIGDIACGTPITAEQNVVDRIGVPAAWRADYALTCHGDSMVPKIQDGDIVCVRCQPTVENGEIAVVLINGEATLKRFYRQGDTVTLMPENQAACAPMVYQGPEINELCIEGKAVGICRAV